MVQEIISLSQDGCIANGVFYATAANFKKTDFMGLKVAKKPVILIHPSTMKLFKFWKGGPVLVHSSDDERVCWPCAFSDVGVGCVAFPCHSGLKFNPGDKLTVHSYEKVSDVAAKLCLSTKCKEKFMSSKRFKAALLRELDHMFVRCSSTISIHYLGVFFEFSVLNVSGRHESISQRNNYISRYYLKDLKSTDELNQLTKSFSVLTLKDKLCDQNKDITNCLLHCESPSNTSIVSAEAEHQCDSISSRCKVYDYHIVTSQTKVSVETLKERELKQRITFDNVAGLQKQLHIIKVIIGDLLSTHYIQKHDRLYTGVLLSGPSGTGKTLVARAISDECEKCGITFITVNQSEINDSHCEINIAKVQEKFKEAVKNSPSILFIDDIDQILPNLNERSAVSYPTRRLTDEIVDMIDAVMAKPHCEVLILATAKTPENINPVILKLKRIDKEIKFDVPDLNARYEILKKLLSSSKHNLTEEQLKSLAENSDGYTGADLSNTSRKALQYAAMSILENPAELNEPIHLDFCHFTSALKEVKPAASKELFCDIPKVKWSDIGGMQCIKDEINEYFDTILNRADFWNSIGMAPPCGLLMYGPPGCAKTMIAMAVANEVKANFIPIKGPELLNKYVGESEKAVHTLFQRARRAAPCIIYFDEIDSIAIRRRGHEASSRVDERVLSQLLVEMSGVNTLEGVIVVASTNRPHMIDLALLRPGRFDNKVYIPLPDSLTRREILLMKVKGIPADEINIQDLIERTEGYSCAEVVALCDKAIQTYIVGEITSKTVAFMPLFHELLNSSPPRTSRKLLDIYEKFSTDGCFNK